MSIRLFFLAFFLIVFQTTRAQELWTLWGGNPTGLFKTYINCWCPDCSVDDFIGPTALDLDQGCTVTPNGNLFAMNDYNKIYHVDTATGAFTLILNLPHDNTYFDLIGLASGANDIFYSVNRVPPTDTLYEINISTGTVTILGTLLYDIYNNGELTFFNGDLYYMVNLSSRIAKISLDPPLTNEIVVDFQHPASDFRGLTASTQCHSLISFDHSVEQYVVINTLDGDIVYLGNNLYIVVGITSLLEHQIPDCVTSLDLDCNNSSGAEDYDYNAENYYCFSEEGVAVSDYDVLFLYDTLIDQMTIELAGTLPDGINEYLELEQSFPNLIISGSGTTSIVLQSDGQASSTRFKAALRQIRYHNSTLIPTPGTRIVNVNAMTYYGTATNQATAFIDVVDWPSYDLDLGQDVQVCEGEQLVLNTHLQGVDHIWSTNETSQSITVSDPGTYSVTVTGDELCPNIDSIIVSFVPNVFVQLGNDIVVCEGEEVYLTIDVESPYPLSIEIISTPGGPITLTGISTNTEIPVIINEYTHYLINSVTSQQAACITIGNEDQVIDIFPGYNDTISTSLCEGDSMFIDHNWIYEPGYYTEHHNTLFGCDSIVIYHVTLSNAISILQEINTCVVADTGIFFQIVNNPVGCDTFIETHVQLGVLDTTFLMNTTCRTGEEGVLVSVLTSSGGCDSVVVNATSLLPPQDTSWVNQISCDSTALGINQIILENQEGCDSLVITTVLPGFPDSTYTLTTSCDSSSLGLFETHFVNQIGCDSVVFTTVTYSDSDSTFIQSASCDPSSTGVYINTFINRFGCDSIVVNTVSLLMSHEVLIQSATCNESEAGVFTDSLTNVHGCDSVVITTVDLLPSDETFLFETTCMSSSAGIFTTVHLNQSGCDSVVTLNVSLIPADTTFFISKTCNPSEAGSFENIYTNQEGCDSLVIENVTLNPLPQLSIEIPDFNGYGISCFGAMDGSATAIVNGIEPSTYQWSTNEHSQSIAGLSPGTYSVTVTDGNSCTAEGEVTLFEPDPFSLGFEVSHPDCFDSNNGAIMVQQSGGVEPIRYSIDNLNFQASPLFESLSGGTYTITAVDANDCDTKEILWLNAPLMVNVELGDDMLLISGDTIVIRAIVNVPFDSLESVQWNGLANPDCPECLTQAVAPIITTTYSVSVSTKDGCSDEDALTLFVEDDGDVYVPNIFSPNGDGINDELAISAGTGIEMIASFVVFDRWGNVLYLKTNALPHEIKWNGAFHDQEMNQGVFAYRLIVQFTSGEQQVTYGDITLVR